MYNIYIYIYICLHIYIYIYMYVAAGARSRIRLRRGTRARGRARGGVRWLSQEGGVAIADAEGIHVSEKENCSFVLCLVCCC